jgi:hypothetical protein
MSTTSLVATASSSPPPSSSPYLVVTITVAALTTTFTPPATCTQNQLSQMSSPGYFLWLNEPQPVPATKVGDCYPSQFIEGYTSLVNQSSSIAPMFSPLVCPEGWHTATAWTNGYIACCNSYVTFHFSRAGVDYCRIPSPYASVGRVRTSNPLYKLLVD